MDDEQQQNNDDDADDDDDGNDGGLLREQLKPRKLQTTLLSALSERPAETLDYLGVSFGVTPQLYRFWQRNQYLPLYIRMTSNSLTGEHSCIMAKPMPGRGQGLHELHVDFRRRFVHLLAFDFSSFTSDLALRILKYDPNGAIEPCTPNGEAIPPLADTILSRFSPYDRKRLESYAQSLLDYHVIMDMVPQIAELLVLGYFNEHMTLNWSQASIVVGLGLQKKTVTQLEAELQVPSNQLLAFFNKSMRKFASMFHSVEMAEAEEEVGKSKHKKAERLLKAPAGTMDDDLEVAAIEAREKMRLKQERLLEGGVDLGSRFLVPDGEAWEEAIDATGGSIPSSISVKRTRVTDDQAEELERKSSKKKKKKKKKKASRK